jgi:hypothetical protein
MLRNSRCVATTLFCLLALVPTPVPANTTIDGKYIGWKPLQQFEGKWFHKHQLELSGDQFTLKTSPRVVKKGKIWSSAADGGFYTYKGKIFRKGKKLFVKMKVVECDYCGKPRKFPEEIFEVILENDVTLLINNVRYVLLD